MKCPLCKDEMIILELEGVEIDYCFDCGGIWLDKGELEILLSHQNHGDQLLDSIKACPEVKEKKRKCPICRKKMEKISVEVNNTFILDRCKNAHGIWFDKGELKGILRQFELDKKINSKLSSVLSNLFSKHSKGE